MLDQEEHSAETETGERGEVIKGRTELDSKMGGVQNRRRGEAVKGRDRRVKIQGRGSRRTGDEKLIPFFLFLFMTSAGDV